MALRANLADISLGDGDVHCPRAGEHDLLVPSPRLLVLLVKRRLIMPGDPPFHLLGAQANGTKIDGRFRRVERAKDVGRHLRRTQDAANCKRDEQHEGCERSPTGEIDKIHCPNSRMTLGGTGPKLEIEANRRTALMSRGRCRQGRLAGNNPRDTSLAVRRAGRPLMARRKGRALSSTAQGALRRSQKGEGDTLRRRDL